MPRSFKSFIARTRSIAVFPDDPDALTVEYRPEVYNEDYWRKRRVIEAAQGRRERGIAALTRQIEVAADHTRRLPDDAERERLEEQREAAQQEHAELTTRESAELLMLMIAGWDLYEDDELTQRTPVTYETLTALGGLTLLRISQRINEDMSGVNPTNVTSSGNGSAAAASADSLQTGGSFSA